MTGESDTSKQEHVSAKNSAGSKNSSIAGAMSFSREVLLCILLFVLFMGVLVWLHDMLFSGWRDRLSSRAAAVRKDVQNIERLVSYFHDTQKEDREVAKRAFSLAKRVWAVKASWELIREKVKRSLKVIKEADDLAREAERLLVGRYAR